MEETIMQKRKTAVMGAEIVGATLSAREVIPRIY